MQNIRLLIADDHSIVLQGLHSIFDGEDGYEIVGEAEDGQELVEKTVQLKPDVIISDHKMPYKTGIEAARTIKNEYPEVKIIIFTGFSEEDEVKDAMDAHVDGYIIKEAIPEELINAVELVCKGYSCIYTPDKGGVNWNPGKARIEKKLRDHELTKREMEIYYLIAENYSNKEIASRLFISEATVKSHISRILRKTGQPNRAQAVLYGLSKGFINMNELRNIGVM